MKCIKCTNAKYNWLISIVAAFIPSTVLLMIFITLRISFMSAPLNAFIFVSQIIASPLNVRQVLAGIDHGSKINYPHSVFLLWILESRFL